MRWSPIYARANEASPGVIRIDQLVTTLNPTNAERLRRSART
jgi:hypothetical protein